MAINDTGEIIIREMERGEEFADWFADLVQRHDDETGEDLYRDEHYLVLSNEIGDWIGGLRYSLQGGVAQLLELAVAPEERHRGHAHRLLQAFEQRAIEAGTHLAEFWTDDLRSEAFLLAFGWNRVLTRRNYIGGRTWFLMDKRFLPEEPDETLS
ncbi:MAG: GNAT family N-acetyltransferase [Gemmatimonadales bacterium]